MIDSYLTEETVTMDRILTGSGSPMERIYRLLDASRKSLQRGGCRGGCPIGNFALEMSDIHSGFRKRVNGVFDVWAGRLQKVLREAKKTGEIPRSIPTKALAHFVIAVWEGGVMLVKTRRDPRVLGGCIKSLKGMFRAGRA